MGNGIKGLVKDTAIYGITNIVSKFLNWLLAPFYIRVLANSAEYGIVTHLYAWVSVVLVVLTLGLETGLFRFINGEDKAEDVYTTCCSVLVFFVTCFLGGTLFFLQELSSLIGYAGQREYIGMFLGIVSLDAFLSLPFAYLRYQKKALRFSFYKFAFVFLNIFFNLLFFVLFPYIHTHIKALPTYLYQPNWGVGYIFLSNLLATGIEALLMVPVLFPAFKGRFIKSLLPRLCQYCLPLVFLGLAGIFNKMAGQILIPLLFDDPEQGLSLVGIFGGNLKIAVVMVMFLQAFRFAYDPFIFSKMKEKNATNAYRLAMDCFLFFAITIFLFVMFWMDLFKHIVRTDYYIGLKIVPYMMISEIIFGLYYNLSIWYKLTDRTYFGAIFSLIGLVTTISVITWGVPKYGIVACGWSAVICNSVMLICSGTLGHKYYPIRYNAKRLLLLSILGALFYLFGVYIVTPDNIILRLTLRSLLLLGYICTSIILFRQEFHTLKIKHS